MENRRIGPTPEDLRELGIRELTPEERAERMRRKRKGLPPLDVKTAPVRRSDGQKMKKHRTKHPHAIRLGTRQADVLRSVGRGNLTHGIEIAAGLVEVLISIDLDWPHYIEDIRKRGYKPSKEDTEE